MGVRRPGLQRNRFFRQRRGGGVVARPQVGIGDSQVACRGIGQELNHSLKRRHGLFDFAAVQQQVTQAVLCRCEVWKSPSYFDI